jgi:diguanylate cyclase (GGDEF)-like protein
MFENLNITKKFPIVMIVFSLISVLVTASIAYTNASLQLKKMTEDKLFSLLESRKATLHQHLTNVSNDVIFHSQTPSVINAVIAFSQAWKQISSPRVEQLQATYIDHNPYAEGQKHAFLYADNNTLYDKQHKRYHPDFLNLTTLNRYHDLFLFDTQGNLIYTVAKERDFATNILIGEWSKTHLAELYRAINDDYQLSKVLINDFNLYEPSDNKAASFIGTKVYNQDHKVIGTLILQMPIEPLNSVMQVTAGMGESGETYVVGKDKLMRSDSRFYSGRSILRTRVDTKSVNAAIRGESGVHVIEDYRGVSVYSAYAPFYFSQLQWEIIAEIDEQEVMQPIYQMNYFLFISTSIVVIIIIIFGYLLSVNIARPIVDMTKTMQQLSDNDLAVNISVSDRKDEVGLMAKALQVFKNSAIERDKFQQQLVFLANHDSLTGLPSREFAAKHISSRIKLCNIENNKFALLFIDLDGFKLVNDTYGHKEGDLLLKEVASRLKECVRSNDFVSRLGGDEFIVMLTNLESENHHLEITNRILSKINFSYTKDNKEMRVTASIGIAMFPDDAASVEELIKAADAAMYQAKASGKSCSKEYNIK